MKSSDENENYKKFDLKIGFCAFSARDFSDKIFLGINRK